MQRRQRRLRRAMASTPPVSSEPQPQAEGSNTSHATNSETPSNFSAALASWRDINLAELQKTLDGQGQLCGVGKAMYQQEF